MVAGGAFSIDNSSSIILATTSQPVRPCSAVSGPDGTLTTDCLDALIIDVWDSGGTLNANGVTFTLFLLAAQPPGTFTNDAAGTQRYADLCGSVGLRTVVTGQGAYSSNCALYKCMPLPDWGDDDASTNVHANTGWDELVIHYYSNGAPPQVWSSTPCPAQNRNYANSNYNTYQTCDTELYAHELRPVCGVEHAA